MLSERDIEAAHPEAFDFVWGNLPAAKRAEFNRHLSGCPYCQAVVDEYREIGRIIKLLPPHVEPTADFEDRTVAAMVAALAEEQAKVDRPADAQDRAATQVYRIPEVQPPAWDETRVQPRPQLQPPAEPQARPEVTRLPVWRRYRGRLAAVVAAAAAIIIAAIVIPLSLGGRQLTVVVALQATAAAKTFGVGAAAGQATARQVGESWTFDLSVHGLKPLPDKDVYVCWWIESGSTKAHPIPVTGGSFIVGDSGSTTLTMTTGVDPRDFRTMEITAEKPGNGALTGPVLLTGKSTTT